MRCGLSIGVGGQVCLLLAWGCAASDPARTGETPDPEITVPPPQADCRGGWEPLGPLATEVYDVRALAALTARPVVAWITTADFVA